MSNSLVDTYCIAPHAAPLTAAKCDPRTGARITADEAGTVAIVRAHDIFPSQVFDMGAPVRGAVAVSSDAALVAVGDDQGTVAVYDTVDGSCLFESVKEGEGGRARAMRTLAFDRSGSLLASLAIDGIVRIFDLQTWSRRGNYQGYGLGALQFDEHGKHLLLIDELGVLTMLDLERHEPLAFDPVPGGAVGAHFTDDYKYVVAYGPSDICVFGTVDRTLRHRVMAQSSTGILNITLAPDGWSLAAVTLRSVHLFSVPELSPMSSERHGAAEPTGAVLWDARGVAVGGRDGQLHRPRAVAPPETVRCCSGAGEHRVAVHGDQVAIWSSNVRRQLIAVGHRFEEVRIDASGRVLAGLARDGTGVHVYGVTTGAWLFDCGPETDGAVRVEVAGGIVACLLPAGRGARWFDLQQNRALELDWVRELAVSTAGTWLAAAGSDGEVRIIDALTGEDATEKLPRSAVPVRALAFVNRRPELLVVDVEGNLEHFDLSAAVSKTGGIAASGTLYRFDDLPDALWGVHTDTTVAVARVPAHGRPTAGLLYVDLAQRATAGEVTGLQPNVTIDPERGDLLQPARGAAILEADRAGNELRVLRSLPDGQWIAYDPQGVLASSPAALG